jgi:serine phosphatase RsbU (regulator of sigma subunit)
MDPADLTIAAASRPYPGETANGDAWQLDWFEGALRIAVIDGLGHGPQAALAAAAARKTLGRQPDLSPVDALKACHTALIATRGAAMSVATIDSAGARLTFAGVGNVEGHLVLQGRQQRLVAHRGIVGAAFPTLRSLSFDVGGEWLLLMHTDGIRARFQVEDMPARLRFDPQEIADALLGGWSRDTDDATIVVIRHAAGGDIPS